MSVFDLIESTANEKKRPLEQISRSLEIITELREWQQDLLDIYLTEPDNRTVNWIFDRKGGAGKTCFLKYLVHHYKVAISRGGKYSDVCNVIFKTDMFKCRAMCIDMPRSKGLEVSYAALEAIKDGMISNTKYQTGSKLFNPPHVFVFSNYAPDRTQFSSDRLNVINI